MTIRSDSYYKWEKEWRSLYNSWNGMNERCYNPNRNKYPDYGGRGIGVMKRWHKFQNFLDDMKSTWKKGLTLERINNNKDYSKKNCRWATRKEQANNRRDSRFITFNGEIKTLATWINILGLKSNNVRQQFYCYKWPIERCFTHKKNFI